MTTREQKLLFVSFLDVMPRIKEELKQHSDGCARLIRDLCTHFRGVTGASKFLTKPEGEGRYALYFSQDARSMERNIRRWIKKENQPTKDVMRKFQRVASEVGLYFDFDEYRPTEIPAEVQALFNFLNEEVVTSLVDQLTPLVRHLKKRIGNSDQQPVPGAETAALAYAVAHMLERSNEYQCLSSATQELAQAINDSVHTFLEKAYEANPLKEPRRVRIFTHDDEDTDEFEGVIPLPAGYQNECVLR